MSEISTGTEQEPGKENIVNDGDLKTLLEEERKKRAEAEADRKKLTTEVEKERRSRTDAERARQHAETRAVTAERNANDATSRAANEVDARYRAQEDSIAAQQEAAEAEADRLESEIADLQEAGKFTEAAKLNRQLGAAAARSENLKMAKQDIEDSKTRVKAQVAERAKDPLAAFSSNARAWIDRHPQYLNDRGYQEKVIAAHYAAKVAGHSVDSDPYFKFIEEQIGERDPETRVETRAEPGRTETRGQQQEEQVTTEKDPPERAAPVAAVQRRSTGTEGTARAGEIRLTPLEKEAADITMPDIDENDHVDPKTGVMKPGRYRLYHERKQKNRDEDRFLLPSSR